MAKTTRVQGFTVKHAPGVSAAKVSRAVSELASEKRLTHSPSCPVIIFRGRGGSVVAAQRCEGRKLAGAKAKARWNRIKGKKVCRNKTSGRLKRCR